MAEESYKPGEVAPVSGVYVVVHAEHRSDHHATLLQGEPFPSCSVCHNKVRFRIRHIAVAVRQDNDFSGA